MQEMAFFFIALRWIHLSTRLIRLILLVLYLLLMPILNFLPDWIALSLLRFRLPPRLPMMFILRPGQGLEHREIPLGQEGLQPLDGYFKHRELLAEHWRERAAERRETVASWSRWAGGDLILGQRGPLAERGIREIIAKLGQ